MFREKMGKAKGMSLLQILAESNIHLQVPSDWWPKWTGKDLNPCKVVGIWKYAADLDGVPAWFKIQCAGHDYAMNYPDVVKFFDNRHEETKWMQTFLPSAEAVLKDDVSLLVLTMNLGHETLNLLWKQHGRIAQRRQSQRRRLVLCLFMSAILLQICKLSPLAFHRPPQEPKKKVGSIFVYERYSSANMQMVSSRIPPSSTGIQEEGEEGEGEEGAEKGLFLYFIEGIILFPSHDP